MEVEDIIFDYFGIISGQYEISNRQMERDMDYVVAKMRQQGEIAAAVNPQQEQGGKDLTYERALELGKRIQDFTRELMGTMTQVDPQSG